MSMFRRFLNLFRQETLHREFDDELRFHMEMRIDRNMRDGMNRDDAEAEARSHLGNSLNIKEDMRDTRIIGWIESLVSDIRHGLRLFKHQPGLTALAVLTLSLGIGANATIFSLLNAALFRPLPFADSQGLVALVDGFRAGRATNVPPTVPELLDTRQMSRDLKTVSFYDTRDFQIYDGREPVRVFAARVEASFLGVLGARPSYGRLFVDGENLPGRDRVVILSDGLWRQNFGGDPGIVGRQIIVNGSPSTVVGILPPEFSFNYLSAEPVEMYLPFPMNENYTSRNAEFANVRRVIAVARLNPDYTVQQASAELDAISKELVRQYPALYRTGSDGQPDGFFMSAVPLRELVSGSGRPVLMLLFGAVVLLLLIACTNTAQFLLARSMEREPEVAVRSALGASRLRLIRQFLSEALILGATGGVFGILQAIWLTKGLHAILPANVSLVGRVDVDFRVVAFTAAVALLTTLACGLVPALRLSRNDLNSTMRTRGISAARTRSRQVLIVLEVGIAVVLLAIAGSLTESLLRLRSTPAGYSAESVTVLRMRMNNGPTVLGPRLLDRVMAIPGVDSAALGDAPLVGFAGTDFAIEGRQDDAATLSRQLASYRIVSPGYFRTLRIPLLDGREFENADKDGPPVAIINEEMAKRFWPGQSPMGKRIRAGMGPRAARVTIVGVVGNVRPPLQFDPAPQVYVTTLQQSEPNMNLIVRSASGVPPPVSAVKDAVRAVVPDQAIFDIRPLNNIVSSSAADPRTVALLLVSFALLALFMSVTGVYTVVSYVTSRRTKEIAIRRATGAQARDVLALVARQVVVATVVGVVLGLGGAVSANGILRSAVLGVVSLQPVTLSIVSGLYLVAIALAVSVPAMRALRVNPANILRND
jgi:putative ABC transport system permease protein